MAAIKKASFASQQNRAGPAPLASFEDLPSDELESPNSSREREDTPSPPPIDQDATAASCINAFFTDEDSTPGTLMCSPLSVLQIDITQDTDNESQHTLTNCEGLDEELNTKLDSESLSSASTLRKLEVKLEVLQCNDLSLLPSPDSLSVDPSPQTSGEGGQRKGSWTDIFRSRSRSRSHSPQPSPQSPRKAAPELPFEEPKEESKKQKKGLFSIFKFHDKKSQKGGGKSPVNLEPTSNAKFIENTPSDSGGSAFVSDAKTESIKSTNSDAKNLDSEGPFNGNEQELKLNEDDTFQTNNFCVEVEPHPELRAKLSLERKSKSLDHEPAVEQKTIESHGSSESELASENPEVKNEEEEETDFEAETLLAQDSVEYDETSESITPEVFKVPSTSQPRRQRLEITTVPIERPRSTTPISVAPFEAFIQSAQQAPTQETNMEKIKVLLPGEQFSVRLKSPKRNLPNKSWQDFCHSGLHSPRSTKRAPKEDASPPTPTFPISPFDDSDWANEVTFKDEKWQSFEPFKCMDNKGADSDFSKDSFTLNFNCLPMEQTTACKNTVQAAANKNVVVHGDDWSTSSSSDSSQ